MIRFAASVSGLGLLAGLALAPLLVPPPAWAAAEIVIPIRGVSPEGVGAPLGTLTASDGPDGLVLVPALRGLPPGPHGLHLHQFPSCAPAVKDGHSGAALAAGGHFDPDASGAHRGPEQPGHRGDLPRLEVAADGTATAPLRAPRLHLADLPGHAVVIHQGGDTYADAPQPLGGGGARIACGVVP
ncbi:superoxide dismutase family protein [Phaeospirillum tilakii]|uniref:Superoxide dismutase [Cu-Zn] n=1 Tax=Phaeospirillum tilakii TaxID=741673 RepID=A0ABW5C8F1_9PROT